MDDETIETSHLEIIELMENWLTAPKSTRDEIFEKWCRRQKALSKKEQTKLKV